MSTEDPFSSLIERVVASCLDEVRKHRNQLIDRACRDHPEHAERIREELADPDRAQLPPNGPRDSQHIGPYRLLNELGRGGQAVVYLAEDTRLHRQVALKILKGFGPLSDNAMARFRREAEVTSKLDHPGICAVYDTGVEGEIPYIAMRLVHGTTLASRIADAKSAGNEDPSAPSFVDLGDEASAPPTTPPASKQRHSATRGETMAIVAIIEETARALHVAHEAGVIHRDIKPGNVIVSPDGQPVILDFGLASDEEGEFRTLTQSGDLFGTPAYMSPEQLMAQRVRLDRRTDVYSLGATLYECLVLRQPFEAPTREGVYQAIQYKEPPDVRKLNPHLPKDLKIVVETALQKDRDRRYATALAFAEDLRRVRASEPITAKPVGPIGRVVRFAKRRPAMAALIGVLVFAVPTIAGLGGFLAANWKEIEQQKQQGIDREVERHLENGYLELAEGAPENAIAAFDGGLALTPQSAEAIAGKAMALLRLGRAEGALHLLDTPAAGSEDALLILRADALDKLARKAEADDIRSRIRAPTTPLGLFLDGQRDAERGDASFKHDLDAYRSAVAALSAAAARAPSARLIYHSALARAASDAKQHDVARRIVAALTSLWPESSTAWYQAGYSLNNAGDAADSISAYRRALAIDPRHIKARNNLGLALFDEGRVDEAIAEYRRAILIDPRFGLLRSNLGLALGHEGRLDEAIAECRLAITIDPNFPGAHSNLGRALKSQGQIDEAIAEYRRAIAIDPKAASAHTNLGLALTRKGQIDEAIAEYRSTIAIDPEYAVAHYDLGLALTSKGQIDDAIAEYRRAIAINPKDADFFNELGRALRAKGQIDEAIAAWRKAIEVDPRFASGYLNLGCVIEDVKGQSEEALALFGKVLELEPRNAHAHHNRGWSLNSLGRANDAIAEFRKATEIDPLFALPHYGLGLIHKNEGRDDDAVAELRRGIELDPGHARSHFQLGIVLLRQRRPDEAISEYRKAIALDPQDADPRINLANVLMDRDRVDEAFDEIRRAITINPNDAVAHYNSGNAFRKIGEIDEAIAAYGRATALRPKWAAAHNNLGLALRDDGRIDDAVASLRRATEADPRARPNLDEALEIRDQLDAVQSGSAFPEDPLQLATLARAAAGRDLHALATKMWMAAFAEDPSLMEDSSKRALERAAVSAVVAASGGGKDAATLDASERLKLQKSALTWLREASRLWLATTAESPRHKARQALDRLKSDPRLASVRDHAGLAKLSEIERGGWKEFWSDVDARLAELGR